MQAQQPTVQEIMATMQKEAQQQRDKPRGLRIHTDHATAEGHQGDVYVRPAKEIPKGWTIDNTAQSRQVALGTSIGSRHMAVGDDLTILWPENKTECAKQVARFFPRFKDATLIEEAIGPFIIAPSDWDLEHPEHDNHRLPPGLYFVSYQVDPRTKKRVID